MRVTIAKSLLALAAFNLCAASAMAQKSHGKHPGYLQALADLRQARYYLNHQPGGGDGKLQADEDIGIREIDAAINEIKNASIDDGKGVSDVPVDANEHGSPLAKAIETIYKAQNDIGHEEDNPEVRELRHRALDHISKAADAAKLAHTEWLSQMKDAEKH
jgi:hypothetical protein